MLLLAKIFYFSKLFCIHKLVTNFVCLPFGGWKQIYESKETEGKH